ncbi:UV radiation resistance-associated gene protein isoform X2 [Phyllopteryx taeniolatus]|uniref:UV radiation resistance-associated gene protein isoform X2 n=1 Tax=Phyllopteryx taeniolatus TaxID=161469 RepID=UPI002AD3E00B|nr:UV radiation resistance-associated gene protein isoform X2 [Phyllopteryx taeniolatus]
MSSITGRVLASVTNSGASSSRALHVELTSQQRRLRHLRSIAARNIVNKNGSPLLDTYFTLHLCIGDRISSDFYKSEVICDSLNPTWRSLDFGMLPDLLDTSVSCFVVRIWGGQEEQYQLLIEWKVNLDGLRYTGQQIRSRNTNEIIFGLNDGYYAADFDHKDHSERKKNSLLHVDQSSVRNSYSVFSLLRLHTAQRAIKQTQVTVQKIGKEIEEKLRTTAMCTVRKKERECMQLRLAVLRSELQRQRKALGREIDVRQKDMAQHQKKEEVYATQHESLKDERESLTMLHKECTAKREQFLKFSAQLTFRCRQLLSELSYIYPIDVANPPDYIICGVKLPNSEDFQDSLCTPEESDFILNMVSTCSTRTSLSDRHHVSSSIPVPVKSHLGVPTASEVTYPQHTSSPDQGLRKRASSEADKYKTNPPPSYGTAVGEEPTTIAQTMQSSPSKLLSSSLDATMASLDLTDPTEVKADGEEMECREDAAEVETRSSTDKEVEVSKDQTEEQTPCSIASSSTLRDTGEDPVAASEHSGVMNGTLVPGQVTGLIPGPSQCCSVEQAEEIMGTEATNLGLGMGLRVGLELAEETRLEDYRCIPVDQAVAVECDEQVLGELDVAGFEEFSRRIYALNENMSSFRRPRKNSDK